MMTALGASVATIAVLAGGFAGQQPGAAPGVAVEASLQVERNGLLTVTERIALPPGADADRDMDLRVRDDEHTERVFTVRDVRLSGAGTAEVDGDHLRLHLTGPATVTYTVEGAVADVPGGQQARWLPAAGWHTDLATVTARFVAPSKSTTIQHCFAGPAGSLEECTLVETDHTGIIRLEQDGLARGERIDLTWVLPAGTVPATARFDRVTTPSTLFAITGPVALAFAVLGLVLLAGGVALALARRRDAAAVRSGTASVDVLLRADGRVAFASPDGILPGQVGTVIDATVDPVDLGATVLDLAVRNYLWVAEVPGPDDTLDWQLSRRNPPDDALRDFERALYLALLPEGTESVLVSELRAAGRVDLAPTRDALHADAVRQGWLTARAVTGRGPLTWLGTAVVALGVVAAVVLALTDGHALIGVAVAAAGAAVLAGSRALPPRTGRGRRVVGQVLGLRRYLQTVRAADVPAADQEMVFSRSLPYAVVLGESDRWLAAFADLDPEANGVPGIAWFGGFEGERDLGRFAARLPGFLAALDGVLAASVHLRVLQDTEPAPV